MKSKTGISGVATLILRDKDGKVKDVRRSENMVVSAGLCFIAESLINTAAYVMSGMGVGTDNTPAADGDLNLTASAAYVTLDSAARTNKVITYVATFGAGVGTGALVEAIICCAASAYTDKPVGFTLCRTVYSVINKGASDSLEVTWTLTFADA